MPSSQTVIQVCAAVVIQRRRFLLARRPAGSHLAGCWEFPGGKCDAGETLEACIVREIEEELGVKVNTPVHLVSLDHEYPEKRILLHFLRCVWPEAAVPMPRDGQEAGWFTLSELRNLDLAPADRGFVAWLDSHGAALTGPAARNSASAPSAKSAVKGDL